MDDLRVDPTSPLWTLDEKCIALSILKKIAFTQRTGKYLPPEVFEAHLRGKINVSTELVVLNAQGQVYLIQRPTRDENPVEPFPGQWHSPGVTWLATETLEDTIKRLEKREFGGVPLEDIRGVGIYDVNDPERGKYILRIFVAKVSTEPKNPQGKFWNLSEIPWNLLVASHREIVIPMALSNQKAAD